MHAPLTKHDWVATCDYHLIQHFWVRQLHGSMELVAYVDTFFLLFQGGHKQPVHYYAWPYIYHSWWLSSWQWGILLVKAGLQYTTHLRIGYSWSKAQVCLSASQISSGKLPPKQNDKFILSEILWWSATDNQYLWIHFYHRILHYWGSLQSWIIGPFLPLNVPKMARNWGFRPLYQKLFYALLG